MKDADSLSAHVLFVLISCKKTINNPYLSHELNIILRKLLLNYLNFRENFLSLQNNKKGEKNEEISIT
jgi:hypothetical protein